MTKTRITKEELRQMVREAVRARLKEKLLNEEVNVRAQTDIILAAEKEWHDFIYNVVFKNLGIVDVEKMSPEMGNKVLAVLKSEWPLFKKAVQNVTDKLVGFPKEGEENSVTTAKTMPQENVGMHPVAAQPVAGAPAPMTEGNRKKKP